LTESQIQTDIKDYLTWSGWFVFKIHQQGKYCFRGITDLIAIKNGLTIYVEIKTPKGRLSDDQISFMENIKNHGGIHIVARSLDDIRENLKAV
jgi:Holliday junction resolvase